MKYQIIYRRKSWQVCTLTINGTWKTVRRFNTEQEAVNYLKKFDVGCDHEVGLCSCEIKEIVWNQKHKQAMENLNKIPLRSR